MTTPTELAQICKDLGTSSPRAVVAGTTTVGQILEALKDLEGRMELQRQSHSTAIESNIRDMLDALLEADRLRAFVIDLRDHGTRHDLNPTTGRDGIQPGYLKGMDDHVRRVAAQALTIPGTEEGK